MANPLVGIIMGSTSDWATMQHAAETLDGLGIPYEKRVISAHRSPKLMYDWGTSARDRGLQVVIAGAGGAAHLAGVAAALTPLPVLGVPMESAALKGLDSLLSMVQMPGGIPVATFAIGKPGAVNAALFAAAILALADPRIRRALDDYRAHQARKVEDTKLPEK
jgi:5-(carboxyamino)imidazole ribonucleotide mutase